MPMKCLMGNAWGNPQGPSMELHGAWPLGHPLFGPMGNAMAYAHVHSMDLHCAFSLGMPWRSFYGCLIGMPTCASHGIGLGVLHGNSNDMPYGECMGEILKGLPWSCIGLAHWCIQCMSPWAMHWQLPMCTPWTCLGLSHW